MTISKRTILIADDDPRFLGALRTRLVAEGFEVSTAQDAYQAIDLARRTRPDLLVLDVNMPAGNGFSVQERLKNIAGLQETPVIFVTGDCSVMSRSTTHPGTDVLRKPFDTAELLSAVWEKLDPLDL